MKSVVVVEVATVPGAVCPCEANPQNLLCRCKGGRKTGICYHILAVTHLIMRALPEDEQLAICNVKDMAQAINKTNKKLHGGKQKKPKHCLALDDSDDEAALEERELRRINA